MKTEVYHLSSLVIQRCFNEEANFPAGTLFWLHSVLSKILTLQSSVFLSQTGSMCRLSL